MGSVHQYVPHIDNVTRSSTNKVKNIFQSIMQELDVDEETLAIIEPTAIAGASGSSHSDHDSTLAVLSTMAALDDAKVTITINKKNGSRVSFDLTDPTQFVI